ncbi:MAG: redox-regulated ATPase YchF [Oscillospiraceae bacterium]|nr:redox-regulated ATPase YchF [Oscillospiraceae bacterium]
MKLGLVGLPNTGKSTLFNAVTNAGVASASYAFSTVASVTEIIPVPDPRLDKLAEMYKPDKTTRAVLELVDIAGLMRGSSKGEGLGNKFLADIREVDAIVHVVRCFTDDDVMHVDGDINPARDVETVNLELIFSDMIIVDRRLEKAQKAAKGDKKFLGEADFLKRLAAHLEEGRSARAIEANDYEAGILAEMPLFSAKPVIYAANMGESDFAGDIGENAFYRQIEKIAANEGARVMPVCAKIEEEVAGMSLEDKMMFLSDLGLDASGLDRIIQAGYELLGLISFLTAGKPEVRAWTIKKGSKAPQAAGKIHTDFERGFIRAETVAYDDLIACGSMNAAKEKGLVRLEGKEYVVRDGDVIHFRFNI